MRKHIFAAIAAVTLLTNTSWAQLDLGGAIQGAINGATGNTQAGANAAAGANVPGGNVGAGLNASGATNRLGGNVGAGLNASGAANQSGNLGAGLNASGAANQGAGQSWLGRVGNDIRGALQQADNGAMRLQNNLNPSLQQYGFQPGDQLVGANGQPLTQAQFDQYLQSNPNQVRVLRNGQTVVLNGNVQSGAQIYQPGQTSGQGSFYGQGNMHAGMHGSMQSGFQSSGRQRFGITMSPASEGVIVSGVTVGSPASQAGIRPGDQIISVNGQTVANPNAMIQLVGSADANQALDVQFRRNGQMMQSQVVLASSMQGNVRQAGYAQGMDSGFQGQHRGDVNARLDQLERMIQDLHAQVQQLNGQGNDNSDRNSSRAPDRPSDPSSESNQQSGDNQGSSEGSDNK